VGHQVIDVRRADAGREVPADTGRVSRLIGIVVGRDHAIGAGRQVAVIEHAVAIGLARRVVVAERHIVEDTARIDGVAIAGIAAAVAVVIIGCARGAAGVCARAEGGNARTRTARLMMMAATPR
jgi:hypothetical protein